MSDKSSTGKIKTPEEERKIRIGLREELYFNPEKEINILVLTEEQEDDKLLEAIRDGLNEGSSICVIGRVLLTAIVRPPGVRTQIIGVAAHDEVKVIDESRQLPPAMTIDGSHFH